MDDALFYTHSFARRGGCGQWHWPVVQLGDAECVQLGATEDHSNGEREDGFAMPPIRMVQDELDTKLAAGVSCHEFQALLLRGVPRARGRIDPDARALGHQHRGRFRVRLTQSLMRDRPSEIFNNRYPRAHSLVNGRVSSAVSEAFPSCDQNSTGACIETVAASSCSSYSGTYSSSSSRSKLMSTTVTAEGGGWGVSISASAPYMSASSLSTQSAGIVLGKSCTLYSKKIKNPSMTALSDTAKTLLQNNPEAFLEAYGVHYVQEIVYGGSFIGSYHMAATQQSDSSSLGVFAAAS